MTDYKALTKYLVDLGIEEVPHTGKSYLAHLVAVYRFMEADGCDAELCGAGMFHSIYGTQQFQGFRLELDRREALREMLGKRAERLAYLNCAMDRAAFDEALTSGSCRYRDRITGEETTLSRADFDDLCRVHLYDWLEQVPRSRLGWGYRRDAYRAMARRSGPVAEAAYARVFGQEPQAAAAP